MLGLLNGFSTAPHYQELLLAFISGTLSSAPSTHKAFEKALIAAIQVRDAEERKAREKAEGKQLGLGKFTGKVTAQYDEVEDDEEEEYMDETPEQRLLREESEDREYHIQDYKTEFEAIAHQRRQSLNVIANAELAKKARRVDADAQAKQLAEQGFVFVMPDDGKKKKKGGR